MSVEIAARVEAAGVRTVESRLTDLADAAEIAGAMVSNLLVVLYGDRATHLIVNAGSRYH